MFRPHIQKTRVMVGLTIIVMCMVYWAVNSYKREPTYGFDLKKKTIDKMENSIEFLRSKFISDEINLGYDFLSFGSFLIGPSESIIKTTSGSLISKLSTLNPDFGAMIMEMLIELEVKKGDRVALSYTGSYPGANLAVLSALESLGISAIIISSCGSSEYGATFPNFTWIDIEKYLYNNNIFSNSSSMGSIGGSFDLGAQLGESGKKVCESSIYNYKIELLNIEDSYENIQTRMNHYLSGNDKISLFINVGGGVYSTGDSAQRSITPVGIIYPGDMPVDPKGTVIERFLDMEIPVININHINILSNWYKLPYPPGNNHKYGTGDLFYSKKKYNPLVIFLAFFISSGIVLLVGIKSHNQIKKRMHSSEPGSLL